MGLGRGVLAFMLGLTGCTKSNPAFDADETESTRGDDPGTVDGATAGPDDDGAGSEVDDASEITTDPSGDGTTMPGMLETSGGGSACAEVVEYDWQIEIMVSGKTIEITCDAPYVLMGNVTTTAEDMVTIVPCDVCGCASTADPIEVHAPGVLPMLPASADCSRVEIEWHPDIPCRPVGFTASFMEFDAWTPVALAGQDVKRLPFAVGGAELGFDTVEPCPCDGCCPQTGVASMGFAGVQIREGTNATAPDLLGDGLTWDVQVHEAHVDEVCTPALSWTAVVDGV